MVVQEGGQICLDETGSRGRGYFASTLCTCKVLHSIQPTISAVLRQKCIASRALPEMRGVVTVLDAQLELAHDAQRMRVGLTAQRRFARLSYVYVSVVYLCVCGARACVFTRAHVRVSTNAHSFVSQSQAVSKASRSTALH